jgi:outer membrane protein assembly factor BamD (BamD/ComL family)
VTSALSTFRNIVDRFPTTPWAERSQLRIRECREALARHEAQVASYYLEHKSLRAAESRLHGLLTEYPETDAAAETLWAFGRAYEEREDTDGARLAYATLLRYHPDDVRAKDAREHVANGAAPDPLPQLLAFLESARSRPDRVAVPRTVSAYPERGGATPPGPTY